MFSLSLYLEKHKATEIVKIEVSSLRILGVANRVYTACFRLYEFEALVTVMVEPKS